MQTLFTIPSRPQKGRPTTHQPSGGALTSTPGGFIGGHARTHEERMVALARIRALTAADFAKPEDEKKAKRKEVEEEVKEWFREHATEFRKSIIDPDAEADDGLEILADVDDIDESGRTAPLGYGYDEGGDEGEVGVDIEDETDDDGLGEVRSDDANEPAAIDALIARRESLAHADRWGHSSRPALGFENGAPLGIGTADICERGQDRTKSKPEMTRADEAREFQRIRQAYPIDGYDYKVLCYLCDPDLSKAQIAKKLGRDPRAIRYAAGRIRKQAASGRFRTRRGAGATGINMDDRQEVGAWLTQPLLKAACGRKKKGAVATPKKIRIRAPKRLRLAPLVAVVATNAPRPYKPRRPRTRWVDPAQVDMFAFDMAA